VTRGRMLPVDLAGGCRLRSLEDRDAEELFLVVEANRAYLAEWLPWAGAAGADTVAVFVRRARQQAEEDNGFQAAIVDGSGAIVGVVGFHGVDWTNRATSIGYWLAADQQGRGTMTEAVRALATHAFEAWRLNRVEIRVAVGNRRSAAIPERLGFVREGVLRQVERHADGFKDNVVYSMLADEWSG
jgi:ribosomal-protein-serine acetyltransferase